MSNETSTLTQIQGHELILRECMPIACKWLRKELRRMFVSLIIIIPIIVVLSLLPYEPMVKGAIMIFTTIIWIIWAYYKSFADTFPYDNGSINIRYVSKISMWYWIVMTILIGIIFNFLNHWFEFIIIILGNIILKTFNLPEIMPKDFEKLMTILGDIENPSFSISLIILSFLVYLLYVTISVIIHTTILVKLLINYNKKCFEITRTIPAVELEK